MSLNDNPAVRKAYEERTYTDKNGDQWRRGLDGWFLDYPDGSVMLCRHHDFVALVEKEHPAPPSEAQLHDWEPDSEDSRYRGDPNCGICGQAKRSSVHR